MASQTRARIAPRPWLAAALATAALVGCGRAAPPDPEMAAIQARFGGLKLSWVTRRVVGGQAVVCGYAGPPRKAQVFIARTGKVFVPTDLPAGQFDHWEDQLCGPDWIKPLDL
jgi:hypothetical protein